MAIGASDFLVSSGHATVPTTPLGRLRSWLCCHPGKPSRAQLNCDVAHLNDTEHVQSQVPQSREPSQCG